MKSYLQEYEINDKTDKKPTKEKKPSKEKMPKPKKEPKSNTEDGMFFLQRKLKQNKY